MLPSFFIAHGSPLLAIENNEYTHFINDLGKNLPRPKAIVIFSAHWESPVQQVSEVEQYSTIHDFGGFDPALYTIQYPAKCNHDVSKEIIDLLTANGIPFSVETKRGLDHGSWVVLRLLYPYADIPVIAMSVNPILTPQEQYKIGKSLSVLRDKDILIIASGGTSHNLMALNWADNGEITPWALEFEDWLAHHLHQWDLDSLFHYDSLAPNAQYAVPPHGKEHFIPIFYAMGAADDVQKAKLLHRSFRYGSLTHSVWQFG
ncbi:DODA-type extradiol aromatic ring-opening family dioxygenase [Neobacillus thermocopriae]|uniref:DODA-type extradiol aromatic ring-opening family dioxygenase n=1 Tax=Neobacillus thermocopriae TaxID=1215031 RepID=UPI00376F5C63